MVIASLREAIAQPARPVQAEPVAWEWRKRMSGGMYNGSPYMVWSEWEPLVPPYMDARGFSKTDPENYEIRPLFLSANSPASQPAKLPPMPEQAVIDTHLPTGVKLYGYTADQMYAYALEAIEQQVQTSESNS